MAFANGSTPGCSLWPAVYKKTLIVKEQGSDRTVSGFAVKSKGVEELSRYQTRSAALR